MITIQPEKQNAKTKKIVKELDQRLKYVVSELNRIASYIAGGDMTRRLPPSEYRDSLEVFQTPQDDYTAFGIRSKSNRAKEIKKSYLIYVKPKKRMKTVDKVAKVLEQYSPWTMTTIPFIPGPSDAEVVMRPVNEGLANRVEAMRERQRRVIDPQLYRAGARKLRDPRNLDSLSKTMKNTKTTEDLVVYGASMEFGMSKKAKPHWRPAIALAKRSAPKVAERLPNIKNSLYNSQYKGWQKPNWPETVVTETEGAKYAPFAQLIRS